MSVALSEIRLALCAAVVATAFGALAPVPAHAQPVAECLIQAKRIARIGAPERGVISALHVDRASPVAEGQVIAELEASQERSEVELAQIRLSSDIAIRLAQAQAETAEANAERLTQLVERELVPLAEQEEAVLAAQTARLEEEEAVLQSKIAAVQLAAAEAALERKRIRAPFDGVVTDVLMSVGELYNEQGPILVMARVDPLHVEAFLPLARRADVSTGQTLQLDLETGDRVAAEIDVLDPVLDAATGTFGLRLVLPNPDGAILAGQNCVLHLN